MRSASLFRVSCLALLTSLGLASYADAPDTSTTAEVQAAKAYLRAKYDEVIPKHGLVTGLAYINAELEPLSSDISPRFLPGTRFYRTTLANDAFEFYSVNLLVAVTPDGEAFDVRTCTDTLFSEPSGRFLQLFRQIRASDVASRKAIAIAIGKLLAAVTLTGSAEPREAGGTADNSPPSYKSRILQNGKPWRDVIVRFDEQGWVQGVSLTQPNATPN